MTNSDISQAIDEEKDQLRRLIRICRDSDAWAGEMDQRLVAVAATHFQTGLLVLREAANNPEQW